MEIIDMLNSNIPNQMPSVEVPELGGSVGGLINGKIIICGGKNNEDVAQQECFVIGEPQSSKNMLQKRAYASSVVLNNSTLWVVGGEDENYDDLSSTEMVTLDNPPAKGPDLPFTIRRHCMVYFNKSAIYIIGGMQNGTISSSRDTWIIDPSTGFEIKKGPSMKEARSVFSCGRMFSHGNVQYIVVAGGNNYGGKNLDSVEILDPSSDQGWTSGIVKSNHFL